MAEEDRFKNQMFPRTSAYHPEWIVASASGGANSLWLTEWLASALELKAGMKVLDLGCGVAASSIFLAREFDVTVWATDLWFDASGNRQRILDAGVEKTVYPIHADARSLPFALNFFDVILSIDSFPYYGTDDHYLNYLARFVKPDGILAHAGAGLTQQFDEVIPDHLRKWWTAEPGMWCFHTASWWRRHWERTGIVEIELADVMPDGWKRWLDWHETIAPDNLDEIGAVKKDRGDYLGYVRVIGRRRPDAPLQDPIVSIPSTYAQKPLLRDSL